MGGGATTKIPMCDIPHYGDSPRKGALFFWKPIHENRRGKVCKNGVGLTLDAMQT